MNIQTNQIFIVALIISLNAVDQWKSSILYRYLLFVCCEQFCCVSGLISSQEIFKWNIFIHTTSNSMAPDKQWTHSSPLHLVCMDSFLVLVKRYYLLVMGDHCCDKHEVHIWLQLEHSNSSAVPLTVSCAEDSYQDCYA